MGGDLKKAAFGLFFAGMLVVSGCSQEAPDEKTPVGDATKKNQTEVTEESSYEQIDPKEEKQLLNNKVVYYETPKVKTPAVHKDAEKVIENLAKKKKVTVKPNLQDGKYRDFIYSAASDISSLNKDEQKKVAEFVKYVDKFENQLKNKRIQELMKKVKAGQQLTGSERAELESLLPVKGGQKIINTNPKEKPGTKIGGINQGGNDSEQNNGGTNQGGNDSEQNNGGTNQGGNDSEQNNGGNEQPGSLNGGNNRGGNDTGNDGDNGQNNNNGGNQSGNLIGGNQPPKNSYDPIKARDYAYKWWNKRNNEQYGYYSRVSGGCYDCWYDCTNFVSQAIKEGGIKEKRENNLYWYYSDEKPSYAWGVANSLYKHMKDRKVQQVRDMFDLEVGDIVNVDFDQDGDIEHTAIITKVTPFEVYLTQHTADKKDAPLSAWFEAGYDVYGWKMQTVDVNR